MVLVFAYAVIYIAHTYTELFMAQRSYTVDHYACFFFFFKKKKNNKNNLGVGWTLLFGEGHFPSVYVNISPGLSLFSGLEDESLNTQRFLA